jgi:hypothetical protein
MSLKRLLHGAMLALTILAVGHTAATLNRESSNDPRVVAAFAAMKSAVVPRTEAWLPRSMADFDLGMNLNLSLALLAVVTLLGILARAGDSEPALVRRLLLPILFFVVSVGVTSFVFFIALPAVALCAIAAILISVAAARLRHRGGG